MGALHTRLGFGDGSAFLGQLGVINEELSGQSSTLGGYAFGQGSATIARGWNALVTTEYYTADWTRASVRRFRAGPSLQILPMQRLELRVDLLGLRAIGGTSLEPDSFNLQAQVHVWL
jgi:hypothetical protein